MRPNPKRKHQYITLPVWVFLAIVFAVLFTTFAGWQPGAQPKINAEGNRIIPIGGSEIQKLVGVPGVALAGNCGYCGWYSLCNNNSMYCCTQWINIGCGGGSQSASVTGSVTCDQWGAYGWCRSNAQLVLTVSNPQNETISISGNAGSVPISCTGSCTISLPQGAGTATYTLTASPSNTTNSGSTAWSYDPELPVPGVNVSGTSGANGWYISPVTVSAAATDAISGPAGASISVDGGTEQSSATLTDGVHQIVASAIDNAGNTATSAAIAIKVDTTTPVINISMAGAPGANNWYISDVQVSATATDATSGINTIEVTVDGGPWTIYSVPVTLTDGAHTLQFRATDKAGNVTTTSSQTFQIDTTAPLLAPTVSGLSGSNGWYISTVQVSVTATDATSGVNTTEVAVDGGVWTNYTAPINFTTGQHSLQFRATDKAGNISQVTQTIAVDTNGPVTDLPASWTLGKTITYTVTDNESGLASVRVAIEDEKEHFKQVVWHEGVSGNTFSGEINWDGKFADGTIAPPGVYQVWVKSMDIAGHKSEALGMVTVEDSIFHWFVVPTRTPTATLTASPTPTAAPTATKQPSASVKPFIQVSSGMSGGTSNAQKAPTLPNIPSLPLVSSAVAAMAAYAAYELQRKREEELAAQAAAEEHDAEMRADARARAEGEWDRASEKKKAEQAHTSSVYAQLRAQAAEKERAAQVYAQLRAQAAEKERQKANDDFRKGERAPETVTVPQSKSWLQNAWDNAKNFMREKIVQPIQMMFKPKQESGKGPGLNATIPRMQASSIPIIIIVIVVLVLITIGAFNLAKKMYQDHPVAQYRCNAYAYNLPTLQQCFNNSGFWKFGPNEQVDHQQFKDLLDAVYQDMNRTSRAPDDWARADYDTPFYDGNSSNPFASNEDKNRYPNFPVCVPIDNENHQRCGDKQSSVNYFAQGMYSATAGESLKDGEARIVQWKNDVHNGEKPSPGDYYWFEYGYNYYIHRKQCEQLQAAQPIPEPDLCK